MKKKSSTIIPCIGFTTIGKKGQIVIPAQIRKKLQIKNGDKFIVFLTPSHKGIVIIPARKLERIITEFDKKLAKFKKLIIK